MKKTVFLLIGRDNWQQDDSLNHVLLSHLRKYNHKIIWEDPAGAALYRLRNFERNFNGRLPAAIQKLNVRMVQVLYGFTHWHYFHYLLAGRRDTSIESRSRKLRKTITDLSEKYEIIVISRSSGGRVASVVADDLKIKHIICLGYPFKHPDKGTEPDRYLHLANLKTPMLIIQGTKDEYGGLEVKNKYALSTSIDLLFVDAYHDFQINDDDWERVLLKIDEIVKN